MPDFPPLLPVSSAVPEGGGRFLRCPACGRADAVTQPDLRRYAREGWPRCCGEVMVYFIDAPRPAPAAGPPPARRAFRDRCPSCGRADVLTLMAIDPADGLVRVACLECALDPSPAA